MSVKYEQLIPMSEMLDKIDQKILQILTSNAREKNTVIARQLDITEGAVRKRIKKLKENGVIERFTIELTDRLSGIRAVVGVVIGGTVEPTTIKDEIIKKVGDGIEAIYEVTGEIDLFVILNTQKDVLLKRGIEDIRRIPGVKDTNTYVVLSKTARNFETEGH